MVSLRIWVNASQIVTVTQRPLASLSMVLAGIDIKKCAPIEVAVRLIEKITSLFKEAAIDLESKLLDLDDALYKPNTQKGAVQLKDYASQIIWFKRFAFPQSHALEDLITGAPIKLFQKKRFARVKHCRSITLRLAENLKALQEHVLLLQDHLDHQSEEKRRRLTYLFTLISGVFLPLNLFAGLLGANVGGIPLVDSSLGFIIVCLIAVSMGTVFALAIRKWM
jgi:zinc transporter